MGTAISSFLTETIGTRWAVFLCSMIPIIELRGAIPLGAVCDIPWWQTFLLSVAGNMVPVPFILLFMERLLGWMKNSKVGFFNKLGNFLQRKADKNQPRIEKYGFWGLSVFIGIPLPVTGAWTGSLVAALFNFKFWKAMLSALFGVLIAATIVTLLAYAFPTALKFLFITT